MAFLATTAPPEVDDAGFNTGLTVGIVIFVIFFIIGVIASITRKSTRTQGTEHLDTGTDRGTRVIVR